MDAFTAAWHHSGLQSVSFTSPTVVYVYTTITTLLYYQAFVKTARFRGHTPSGRFIRASHVGMLLFPSPCDCIYVTCRGR